MNIVKGVADLIRRTSGGQIADTSSEAQFATFSASIPKVRFSDFGDEAVLNALWGRYSTAVDKVERRKLFHIFLKRFLYTFKDWEPIYSQQPLEAASFPVLAVEDDVVVGCSAGHPAEIILTLIEEVALLIAPITDPETFAIPASIAATSEGFSALEGLMVVTRSIYNCRAFVYHGGIQKITALMKAAVVQLKTIAGAVSAHETLSTMIVEKLGILQKILLHVVSITCNFVDVNLKAHGKIELPNDCQESSVPNRRLCATSPHHDIRLHWQQKAIVSVMEGGGLNWLVELLRVIRRLSMKEQWLDMSLVYLTLRTLHVALSENPRGQNHFRSIGGIEVLLDGLGFSSINALAQKNSSCSDRKRDAIYLVSIFKLHVLSLEVLREAVWKSSMPKHRMSASEESKV